MSEQGIAGGDWAQRLREWWERQESAGTRETLGAYERGRLMSELGVGPGELGPLMRAPQGSADLLPQMMTRFGVCADAVTPRTRGVLRDLERVCSMCTARHRCARALASGLPAEGCRGFCPNAGTLDALAAGRGHAFTH